MGIQTVPPFSKHLSVLSRRLFQYLQSRLLLFRTSLVISFMQPCHLQTGASTARVCGGVRFCACTHMYCWPSFSHATSLVHLVSCPSSLWTPSIPTSHPCVFPRQENLSFSLFSLQLPPDLIVLRFVSPAVFLTSKYRK